MMRTCLVAAVGLLASCSSGGSSTAHPPTTTKTTPPPTVRDPRQQVALAEATKLMRALHAKNPNFCATPNYATNITLPADQHLPIPVTRATCVYDSARIQVVAFADPNDRAVYMTNYTNRLCKLSNVGGQVMLGSLFWVVNDHTVTLVPSKSAADTFASVAGGQINDQQCPASK